MGDGAAVKFTESMRREERRAAARAAFAALLSGGIPDTALVNREYLAEAAVALGVALVDAMEKEGLL